MKILSYKKQLLLIYTVSVMLVFYLVFNLLTTTNNSNVGNISIKYFESKAVERENYLHDFFSPYFTTIKAINQSAFLDHFINNNSKNNSLNRINIENYFLSIKKSLPCLTQVRYLDIKGNEKVRIDGDPIALYKQKAKSQIVSKEKFQNKFDRAYIKKFISLKKGEIGLSKIDLNKENKKVIIPKQPTLRLGMAVFDKNQNKKGIIVLNICLRTFFKLLDFTTLYHIHLIDEKGKYLSHHDKRYGLIGENMNYSIFDEFPKDAKKILQNDTYSTQEFYSIKVNDFDTGQNIKLILEHKFHMQSEVTQKTQTFFIVMTILFAIVLLPVALYYSKLPDLLKDRLKNKKEIENKNIFINTLLKSLPIPMFYKDINGVYFDINEAFTDMFGFQRNEIIGKTVYDVAPKELADIYNNQDLDLIENYNNEVQIYESIVKNPKTNKTRNVIFHKNIFFNTDGVASGIIGAAVDITELKQTQSKLTLLNENLEKEVSRQVEQNTQKEMKLFESAKLAAMGSMIGNIIHQWKQPLNILSLIAANISLKIDFEQKISNDELKNEMKKITQTVQRLTNITSTFRDFLKEKKELKVINIEQKLDEALVISGTVLKDNNIELIKENRLKKPIEIKTVGNELVEVIINIINNAIDAINEKDLDNRWVKVVLDKDEKDLIISIEDNAGGIPQNIMANIFKEYFTTKQEEKGTGLGLYMSKKIVTQSLNGKLSVINSKYGAKFFVKLPLEST